MSEQNRVVHRLLRKIVDTEFSSVAGRLNFAFGLLIGLLLIILFAASLLETIADIFLSIWGLSGPWEPWAAVAAFVVAAIYFLLSVLIVAVLGRQRA